MKIKCINGNIIVPNQFKLSKTNRRLHVKTPWASTINYLNKDNWTVTTQQWFRQKGKDKPYIKEGLISINSVIYVVEKIKGDKN